MQVQIFGPGSFEEYESPGETKAASSSLIRRFLEIKRDIYISLYPQGCCSTDTGENGDWQCMEILNLGFWSQGPRELDLRSNQGFRECPRQSGTLLHNGAATSAAAAAAGAVRVGGRMSERMREGGAHQPTFACYCLLACHTCSRSRSCSSEAGLCGLVRLSLSLR